MGLRNRVQSHSRGPDSLGRVRAPKEHERDAGAWGGHEKIINGEYKLGQKLHLVQVLLKKECDAFHLGRTTSGLETTERQQRPHLFSF
jgi:hypothetical protein